MTLFFVIGKRNGHWIKASGISVIMTNMTSIIIIKKHSDEKKNKAEYYADIVDVEEKFY